MINSGIIFCHTNLYTTLRSYNACRFEQENLLAVIIICKFFPKITLLRIAQILFIFDNLVEGKNGKLVLLLSFDFDRQTIIHVSMLTIFCVIIHEMSSSLRSGAIYQYIFRVPLFDTNADIICKKIHTIGQY